MRAAVSVSLARESFVQLGRPPVGPIYTHWLRLITTVDRKAKLFLSNDMVHVRTGNLRSSQQPPTVRVEGTDIIAEAVNSARYASYVHDGTKPHDIMARRAQVLTGWVYHGSPVFTPIVHHPGTAGRPWLKRALTEAITEPL